MTTRSYRSTSRLLFACALVAALPLGLGSTDCGPSSTNVPDGGPLPTCDGGEQTGACGCPGQTACAAPPPGCRWEGWTPCACGVLVCDTCGGFAGVECPSGRFCDYPAETACGSGDQTGSCRVPPTACTEEYAPVCGCDGETYSNGCAASAASVSVMHVGACDCLPTPCAAPPEGCSYVGGSQCSCGTLACEDGTTP